MGSGEAALKYLSAYVTRTALGHQRILRDEHGKITFKYKDSGDRQWHTLTLSATEFLRRFLQHVLPKGFQRVRYYGWLGPAAKARWQRLLALLDWKPPQLSTLHSPPSPLPSLRRTAPLAGPAGKGAPVNALARNPDVVFARRKIRCRVRAQCCRRWKNREVFQVRSRGRNGPTAHGRPLPATLGQGRVPDESCGRWSRSAGEKKQNAKREKEERLLVHRPGSFNPS